MSETMSEIVPKTLSAPQGDQTPNHAVHHALEMRFEDQSLLAAFFGHFDANLIQVEKRLGVSLSARGGLLHIEGPQDKIASAQWVLQRMYERIASSDDLDSGAIEAIITMTPEQPGPSASFASAPSFSGSSASAPSAHASSATTPSLRAGAEGTGVTKTAHETEGSAGNGGSTGAASNRSPILVTRPKGNAAMTSGTPPITIRTRRKTIAPRSNRQIAYMEQLANHDVIFALGPAGTGKTYVAVAQAVSQLITGSVQRLILSRPAVEAGERLGFLPGDMKDKVDPYLRPLYDALYDCMPPDQVERRIASGEIEIAPIAFMRGRTLSDAFVILDEAQNTTREQMKMFLTRFGPGSRMVICGDPRQVDIPGGGRHSGLADAVARLEGVEGIASTHFTRDDVVRHPVVGRIVEAYEEGQE